MTPEPSSDGAAEASPLSSKRNWLRRPPPLAIGFFVLFASVAGTIIAVNFFGSPSHSDPGTWLELAPLARAASDKTNPVSFLNARSLAGHLVTDPALIEDSPVGPLPVQAANGRMPMTAYALPVDPNDKHPRIAIVISGLNVSASNTKLALLNLPQEVTLGFSPFASGAQAYVDRAREAGHEVLVEVPMEPFDFPESDPGPHALLVAASAEENLRRLNWSMSRFTGYVGLTNLLGGRFMGEQGAIESVLSETARRGLLFFDDGGNPSSIALTGARHVKASIATGRLALDAIQTREAIDGKLADLEAEAKRNGFAVGVGSVYPITIARVAEWAQSAATRGFELVPISALAATPGQQETATAGSANR